jgi:hypothetical protein
LDYLKRQENNEVAKDMKVVNNHNRELYSRFTPSLVRSRDFLNQQIWCKTSTDTFLVVGTPIESEDHPRLPDVVRGRFPLVMKLRGDGEKTVVEYVIQIDFGGFVPARLTNLFMKSSLAYVTRLQQSLQAPRELNEWDEEDGLAMAETMVAKTTEEGGANVEARVKGVMEKFEGLRELGEKHEWFEDLLTKVVGNKLRPAGESKAKLCNMTVKHAKIIGGALASCIATNLTAPAAVDEWILRYPALKELERE